ncbi:hypothetical protein HMI51_02375 [Corallococcus coralloides]|nr:hypothetical protein [Corallococcus coralloides]
MEFDKGKPTHLVKSVSFEGSGAAGAATGLKGKADLSLGGEVSGSVSIETKTPLDASKLDGNDVLSFLTGDKSDALVGPSETSITVEGSVDRGTQGQYFTAEVSGLTDKEVQSVTDKLKAGKFENAFDDLRKDAKVTQGSFKDRELVVGAKLGVVDFELSARHRDVTAEDGGGGGNGSTTVSLGGGKRRGGSDGPSGSHGSTGGPNRSTGNEATGGTGPSTKKPGNTSTGGDGQPGSKDGEKPSAKLPANKTEDREPPTVYRVNPATGRLGPMSPQDGGPARAGRSEKPVAPAPGAERRPPRTEGQGETRPTAGRRPVPVVRNPELPGRTTHVRYDDGKVRIEAGPDATDKDIQAHMETARVLQRYEGAVGKVRQLIDKVKQVLTGMPGYGSQGFESRLEVKKLSSILQDLEATQTQFNRDIAGAAGSATPQTAAQRTELEQRIASVESQLREHAVQVDSLAKGNGIVAERDDRAPTTTAEGKTLPPKVQQAVETAWGNLTSPEDRQRLSTLLGSDGLAALDPSEQEAIFRIVGGMNPQLSLPIRRQLFDNIDNGYLKSNEFNDVKDQAQYLRLFVPRAGKAVMGMPTGDDKVPTEVSPYAERRKKAQEGPGVQKTEVDANPPTKKYMVRVGEQEIPVTMWPADLVPQGRKLPTIKQVENAIASLPDWALKALVSVQADVHPHFLDRQNSGSSPGKADPTHATFMAAGADGKLTIHPVPDVDDQNRIDGEMVHEMAHTVSKQAWSKKTDWDPWRKAMGSDAMSPSRYPIRRKDKAMELLIEDGRKRALDDAMQEDFSEAVKLYDQAINNPDPRVEQELRALMPMRFALLEEFFREQPWVSMQTGKK